MKVIFTLIALGLSAAVQAQSYTLDKANWADAGYHGKRPVFSKTLNVLAYGADPTGAVSSHTALAAAITALAGKAGTIYFPAGTYRFTNSVNINRDSLLLKGAGADSTVLKFDLNGVLNHCFLVWGKVVATDTTSLLETASKGNYSVTCLNPSLFNASTWVYLTMNDANLMYSSWAYGSLGQILQVDSVQAGRLYFRSPFRYAYNLNRQPKLQRLMPRHDVGFECLKIQRLDATTSQTSLISFDKAVNCWIEGIEGDSTNYAHVELNRSSNISICNSYFHHAMAYGGSGQGYGIAFQYSSNECRVESNVFQHLRHSMLFQAGANGNVCGYNFSVDPYWTEGLFPNNSAGDVVFHGNYPFANLVEGNIVQNMVLDDSHGKNGPGNTLYRNRAELYGLFMNNAPATDYVQFLGNEITNTNAGYGLYTIQGLGHLQYANRVRGQLVPASSGSSLDENSLYRSDALTTACLSGAGAWPVIGPPQAYNTGSNYARDRYLNGQPTVCTCTLSPPTSIAESATKQGLVAYPMPVIDVLHVESQQPILQYKLSDLSGRLILSGPWNEQGIDLSAIPAGFYVLSIQGTVFQTSLPVIKMRKE